MARRRVLIITVDDNSPKMRVEDLAFLTELVESGRLRPVINRTYPLEHIVRAHRYVERDTRRAMS